MESVETQSTEQASNTFFLGNVRIETFNIGERPEEHEHFNRRIMRDEKIEMYKEKIEKYQERIRISETFAETLDEMSVDHKETIRPLRKQLKRCKDHLKDGLALIANWSLAPPNILSQIENLKRLVATLEQDLKDERHNAGVTSKLLREHNFVIEISNEKMIKAQVELNRLLICNEIDDEVDRYVEFYGHHLDGSPVTRNDCISLRNTFFIPAMNKVWSKNLHYVLFELFHNPHHWSQFWIKRFFRSVKDFNKKNQKSE